VTAVEVALKQFRMVGHDLIAAIQVFACNHDEVGVLRKKCGERFSVSTIDGLCKVCNKFPDSLFVRFCLSICEGSKSKLSGKGED
jgi:hypothetical protein